MKYQLGYLYHNILKLSLYLIGNKCIGNIIHHSILNITVYLLLCYSIKDIAFIASNFNKLAFRNYIYIYI